MKIAAVIVTYNRIELLKEVLEAFDNQTRMPDYVIVVNNASTDGTDVLLKDWKEKKTDSFKIVITTENNIGGSGGFYVGTKKALSLDADWIWVSDDDAIPESDVFKKAETHILSLDNKDEVSAICAKVMTDNKIALSNRSYRKKTLLQVKLRHVPEQTYDLPEFECDNFSYVGVLMNKDILERVGLIKAEYFIWRDDVEHSWRLSECGKIKCYPDMSVNHKAKASDYNGISWKTYYAYRNDLLMLKDHCGMRYFVLKSLNAYIHGVLSFNFKSFRLYADAVKAANHMEVGLNPQYCPSMKF